MKKKLSLGIVLVLVLLAFCTAAIAMEYRAGILDFAGRYADVYVPADAQDYVTADVLSLENDLVSVHLHELYYDGRVSRMALEITPKDASAMLFGPTALPQDPWQDLTSLQPMQELNDSRTLADVWQAEGYTSACSVDVWLKPLSGNEAGESGDNVLGADGTLTLYVQGEYAEDEPVRDMLLQLRLTPYELPLTAESKPLSSQAVKLEAPLTLTADPTQNETYVSTEPAEFPSAGVRVDQLRIEVRPLEIHAMIEYTVTDPAVYARQEDGLWLEFIDPASTAEAPHEQRLQGGLTGSGSCGPIGDEPETAARFRQSETLGRSELHESYTLRAYNCWDKSRYETRTFTMKKLEE